jgi:hypothetical protein
VGADGDDDGTAARLSNKLSSSGVKLDAETGSKITIELVDWDGADAGTAGAVDESDEKVNAIKTTVRMIGTILDALNAS